MSKGFEPTFVPLVEVEKVLSDFEKTELGQWYWVKSDDPSKQPRLMCVMEVGSNYAQLQAPESRNGYSWARIHRDEFDDSLTFEPNADHQIQLMVAHYQEALAENLAEIQRLTESLGIAPQLGHQTGDGEGKSLALLSGQDDVGAFKSALILAQKETLPGLFEQNKKLSEELGRWMGAPSLPMKAKLGLMKGSVEKIEDRLFNIQLYSGIFETIFTLADGAPAAREEKLRIMQRRLYMDEECMLAYEVGGMEFKDIGAFDAWLARPENRDRILPFQRCMVSMQVRRDVKDRSHLNLTAFVEIGRALADKYTYLIIRNGEQLYRVCTEQDFGELMFPERATFDPSEPLMMKIRSDKVERMMSKREFDSIVEAREKKKAQSDQWEQENPKEEWEAANPKGVWHWSNPFRLDHDWFYASEWQPFDDSSSYFDQGMQKIQAEIKEYNRIALIVQGLFDRTPTLIPHQPVKMWQAASFAAAVELIYDSSMVLHWGQAPDIQAYIDACNASAGPDSVFFGQDHEWAVREAERQNRKESMRMHLSDRNPPNRKVYRPYGDPGPGRLAKAKSWAPRSKMATFSWRREGTTDSIKMIKATIKLPLDKLFNVSAYKPGDFRQFFNDPRTRAQYLQWAPMMLSAEEFHAGNLEARLPYGDGGVDDDSDY
ncbi:hypothetical protein NPS53_09105 [Pseudomonas putida]|uniref:hypothetical protein n=1 Tax=Pseudomonas putida TaxID=303 RepID=UPI00236433D6|nr:hypothetical protein [Pseudomonas putida]MDD2139733.1 hypothetical protein [Pseudomonas putida]HDS1721657.1 hypothetical protein [Pseudomonas putida]